MYLHLLPRARAALRTWLSPTYNHDVNVQEAIQTLKNIESYRGKTANRDMKLCNDYAVDVLGHRHFAPWLYVYAALSGTFKVGWMPDNYYGSVVVRKLKGRYGMLADLRALNAVILQSDAFPDILSYVNGIFFDTEYRFVSPDTVHEKLFMNRDRIIFKLDSSLQGRGIYFFDRDSFSVDRIKKLGNGLFQRVIKQHEEFSRFAGESVSTIRLTTVYEDTGRVSVRGCFLRLGSGEETHVQSKTQIRVPIDVRSGAFNDVGYTVDWFETRIHPTSKAKFAGNIIPAFNACIDTVTKLHHKVPYARSVGWDVAIDREGNIRLMEWNAAHNGVTFHEATQGPCFADLGWEQLKQ